MFNAVKKLTPYIVVLIIGFAAGVYFTPTPKPLTDNQVGEFHAGGYRLTSPLYECNTGEQYGSEKLSDLESTVQKYIDKVVDGSSTVRAAVYFRDLNNGSWFGINEQDKFAPSSLLKLPVMIAYYKVAEKDPSVLNKKIIYDKDPVGLIPQNFKTASPLQKGNTYTVEQLIEKMITGSDNVSLLILENNIDQKIIDKVTIDLGIPTATDTTPDNFMSVRQYSTLFRVLYNATYLNNDYSQKALGLLSKSEFSQGLAGGVPKGILVAHKFGERHAMDGSDELHDCGIVYYTKRPYLLCVMSQGPDFNDLLSTIKEISTKVYYEFHAKYPKG